MHMAWDAFTNIPQPVYFNCVCGVKEACIHICIHLLIYSRVLNENRSRSSI